MASQWPEQQEQATPSSLTTKDAREEQRARTHRLMNACVFGFNRQNDADLLNELSSGMTHFTQVQLKIVESWAREREYADWQAFASKLLEQKQPKPHIPRSPTVMDLSKFYKKPDPCRLLCDGLRIGQQLEPHKPPDPEPKAETPVVGPIDMDVECEGLLSILDPSNLQQQQSETPSLFLPDGFIELYDPSIYGEWLATNPSELYHRRGG